MADINPINDQEEILREAYSNVPQFGPRVKSKQQAQKPDPFIPHSGIKPLMKGSEGIKFKYSLPMFSYVLSWLYLVGIIIFLAIALSSSAYDTVVAPCLSVVIVGVIVIVSLLIPKATFRYVAITMSLLLCGYEIIRMIGLIDYIIKYHDTLLSTILNSGTLYFTVAPYMLLPIVTVVCLLSPEATRAYK